jgi:hypothetical protein
MTTIVPAEMNRGRGIISVPIGVVASGATATFRPLLAADVPLVITEFRHVAGTVPGTAPTVKLRTQTGASTWEDVSLTGGDDTPDLTTSIERETTDGDQTASASNYVAAGEGIQVVINNSAGGGTDVEDIVIQMFVKEV